MSHLHMMLTLFSFTHAPPYLQIHPTNTPCISPKALSQLHMLHLICNGTSPILITHTRSTSQRRLKTHTLQLTCDVASPTDTCCIHPRHRPTKTCCISPTKASHTCCISPTRASHTCCISPTRASHTCCISLTALPDQNMLHTCKPCSIHAAPHLQNCQPHAYVHLTFKKASPTYNTASPTLLRSHMLHLSNMRCNSPTTPPQS